MPFRAECFDGTSAIIPNSQVFLPDADEILRLKQLSGLAELFADKDFSRSNE